MPVIPEDKVFDSEFVEYKCDRCGKTNTKTSALEPDKGYISQVDGAFVKTCEECWAELPERDKAMRNILETAFIIGVLPSGMGYIIKEEGIEDFYRRPATKHDITAALHHFVDDMIAVRSAERNAELARAISMQTNKVQPRIMKP